MVGLVQFLRNLNDILKVQCLTVDSMTPHRTTVEVSLLPSKLVLDRR